MDVQERTQEIICPMLAAQPGIRHGFFTRCGGVSTGLFHSLNCGYGSGDDIEAVSENRARVATMLGQPGSNLCTAYQVHSARAAILESPWDWRNAPEADALATRTPGIILGILTADCLPVLLSDSARGVIGAAHAGWKGAIGGILESTLEAMESLGASRSHIHATLGPAIAQASYEVGSEFRDRFLEETPANDKCFAPASRNGHFRFDLKAYAQNRLANAGISQVNVLAHDTCKEEASFFSYRRSCLRGEPAYGRHISAIVIET